MHKLFPWIRTYDNVRQSINKRCACLLTYLSTYLFTLVIEWRRWYHRAQVDLVRVRSFCYLLNVWEFVYFVCGLSPPKRRVVRWWNFFARRRVQTMCKTSAAFCFYRGSSLPKNDIFQKRPACRPTVLQRWRVGRLTGAGWLQPRPVLLIVLLLIAQALRWLRAGPLADWLHAGPLQWHGYCVAIWLTLAWSSLLYYIVLTYMYLLRLRSHWYESRVTSPGFRLRLVQASPVRVEHSWSLHRPIHLNARLPTISSRPKVAALRKKLQYTTTSLII